MPREVHETYEVDPDDPTNPEKHRLVSYTVVTRESPWDDKSRTRALRLTEYEDSLCKGCGLPRDESHKAKGFKVHELVCRSCKATEMLRRHHQKQHEKDEAFFDGRQYVAVPVSREGGDDN